GGWPLTIIMTPDKKPFFAATYIPKESRYNMIGMKELIPRIRELWDNDQENITDVIGRIEQAFSESAVIGDRTRLSLENVDLAYSNLSQRFDEERGGFGSAPKFPSAHNLMLILRYWKRTGEERALYMVEKTLQAMRLGGLWDHIGFGFHRYSTDAEWLLPHFEKMLYDQANLMMAYTEAYQITRKKEYADVVRNIFEYVTRNLSSPEGAFYSAEDADSEGEEGKFYTWTQDEIKEVLKDDSARIFSQVYNIEDDGNFEDEASRKKTGLNIPHLSESVDTDTEMSKQDLDILLDNARTKLFIQREKRIRPGLDDKILTDWNGFMIAAIAKAGVTLGDENFIKVAEKALTFILETMIDKTQELFHRHKEGDTAISAFLDDYAYLIWALLEVYEGTFNPEYLDMAKKQTLELIEKFWDEKEGGFYFTSADSEELLVRKKDAYDGAMPSGNSVAAFNLVRLARFLGDPEFEEKASETIMAFSGIIPRVPTGFSMMLNALDFAQGQSYEIVIVGEPSKADTKQLLDTIQEHFIPNKVILFKGSKHQSEEVSRLAPFTKYHDTLEGKATAHVCVDYNCRLPTTEANQLLKLLGIESV
ncbi:MAG: thioredoxin domain-containing protein, partial [Candidatus Thorarchaeota archaeon]